MFLFLFNNNLLLGKVPETLGLLLFGVALVAITIGLRWFLNENEKTETAKEKYREIKGEINR